MKRFERNNIDTELLYIPGGSTIIQAIISGDVKIANMAPPSAIGAWAKGFDPGFDRQRRRSALGNGGH